MSHTTPFHIHGASGATRRSKEALGTTAIITKPFVTGELLGVVRDAVGGGEKDVSDKS